MAMKFTKDEAHNQLRKIHDELEWINSNIKDDKWTHPAWKSAV